MEQLFHLCKYLLSSKAASKGVRETLIKIKIDMRLRQSRSSSGVQQWEFMRFRLKAWLV